MNKKIEQVQITFGNPTFGNTAFEPEIIGALFSGYIKDGQTTIPMKGKSGVYKIQIVSTIKAPANATYKEEREQLAAMMKGNIQGLVISALRKQAEVIDNRKLFPQIRS